MKINVKDDIAPRVSSPENSQPVVRLDLNMLDTYCRYIVSVNNSIKASSLSKIKYLFDNLSTKPYQGDPERMKRIEFIKKGIEARVDRKLKDRNFIIQYINGTPMDTPIMDASNLMELSNEEVVWIDNCTSNISKYMFIYGKIDELMLRCQNVKSNNFTTIESAVNELENSIDDIKTSMRRLKHDESTENDFSFSEEIFNDAITDIYNEEVNPSRKLVTGMQGFNLMIGGGFESSRVYMLFGTAAAGKSFTMLDLMMQIKKYNRTYACKDKTKKPCIVLLTMENSVHETVTRLFQMVAGDKMSNYRSIGEVIDTLKNGGDMCINDDNPIDIYIKYKPNLSVTTDYMYELYDNLEERGYEPIAFFQDHIKRIRPAYSFRDMRLDLGEIVNEMKAFANEKEIPVITDSHLNRNAVKTLEDAKRAGNKQDLARLLGGSDVSESMLMIDNTDVGIIITRDYDADNNAYMGFAQIKTRTECQLDYFAQPFFYNNPIKLIEDYDQQMAVYKRTLREEKTPEMDDEYFNIPEYHNDTKKKVEKEMKEGHVVETRRYDKVVDNGDVDDIIFANNKNKDKVTIVGSPSVTIYPLGQVIEPDDEENEPPIPEKYIPNKIDQDFYDKFVKEECRSGIYFADEDGYRYDVFGSRVVE